MPKRTNLQTRRFVVAERSGLNRRLHFRFRVRAAVVRGRSLASAVCATSRPNGEDVDHLLLRSSIEEDSPLADAEPPEALRPAKALDVALGKPADRGGDALTVPPTQLAEGLQGSGADLDPPLAWVSQRSAPPRPLTRRSPPRSAPP